MGSFSTMLNLQISIFLIMMVGLLFRKKNIITSSTRQGLSDLLINIILPCNIVASFDMQLSGEIWVMVSEILIISLCVQLFVWGLSKVLYRRVPHGPREVLQYGTITSNSGFLGNPMAEGIFGEMGLLYASGGNAAHPRHQWSRGVSLYTRTSGKADSQKAHHAPLYHCGADRICGAASALSASGLSLQNAALCGRLHHLRLHAGDRLHSG